MASTALALDEFHVQISKIAHEETSWRHDIYTAGDSADLWKSGSEWFQKPAVTLRFSTTHHERSLTFPTPSGPNSTIVRSELFTPMLSGSFQTWGGIIAGFTYGHSFQTFETQLSIPGGGFATVEDDDGLDSVGGYVAKQWDCGVKVAGTWSYTWADGDRFVFPEFDAVGGSGALGFARGFGEQQFGRNVFVDTSANFFYQAEDEGQGWEDNWHFVWMAKVGHNICPRVSFYGLFNLFHHLEGGQRPFFQLRVRDYYPLLDETFGEAGGGLQAQFGRGFSLNAEATTPILDEGVPADEAFQVRAALNWRF